MSPEPTRQIEAVVYALIPELELVKIRTKDGETFSITPETAGVQLASLREGQTIRCTVTDCFPRVQHAEMLVNGVTVRRLSEIGAEAARRAHDRHIASGRMPSTDKETKP